jgi:hypothetical protein
MCMLSQVARALQQVFGRCAEEANRVAGVIQRQRKFTPTSLAQSFILAHVQKPDASVTDIAAMATASGVSVTPQAIEQRFSERLAKFFETLFQQMSQIVVAADQTLAPLLARFTQVLVLDSSVIMLPDDQAARFRGCGGPPGKGQAALRLQTEFDLRSGALRTVQIEEGRALDGASSRQHARPARGSLRITDLGYFNLPVFAMIAAAGAYYLSRLQYHTALFVDGRPTAGLIAWLRQCGDSIVDREVEVGSREHLRCRLIAWRMPLQIANQRRRRLRAQTKQKKGRQPTAEALAACDWSFFMTNLTEDKLSIAEAIVLYRARWQIELLFKRWKSLEHLDQFHGPRTQEPMTRFWVRLCTVLIQHWLAIGVTWSQVKNLSLVRVVKLLRQFAYELTLAWTSPRQLKRVLRCIEKTANCTCRRNPRKSPGTYELLRKPELLEYGLT